MNKLSTRVQQTDQQIETRDKTEIMVRNESTATDRGGLNEVTADSSAENQPTENTCSSIPCSIEKALDVLGGKWTFLIIRDLFAGTKRFGELRQSLGGVSPKTLSARLRQLEKQNIIERRAFATIPPTVQYSLTEKGRSLKPIIKAMKVWGARW